MHEVLASVPGLGQVVLCGGCEDVHLSCGNASLRLPKEGFLELCRMLSEAASHPRITGRDDQLFSLSFKEGLPEFRPLPGE